MTYLSNDPLRRSLEVVLRDARQARDREFAALLAGAAMGLANAAAAAMRGLGQAVRSIVSRVASAQRRRKAIRQLQALDDLTLKDIGIARRDIPFLVEQQVSAKRATPAASGKGCKVTAFPDRQASPADSPVHLRPAA